MKKRLILFSVYGNFPLYNDGAYENIAEAREFYPGWICRFYVAENAPILPKLLHEQGLGNCEVVVKPAPKGFIGTMWRFEAISDPEAEYILIRDTDQRVSDKEAQAVAEWIREGTNCHRMAETSGQASEPLMACAIGFKGGVIPNINQLMTDWLQSVEGCSVGERKFGDCKKIKHTGETRHYYGTDQLFLAQSVWPLVQNSCTTHGYNGKQFPPHKPLKWGGDSTFQRIVPGTNCTQIFGNRPDYVYEAENNY